jgi:hypothetical protein
MILRNAPKSHGTDRFGDGSPGKQGERIMDWFERLTGFREADYRTTQARLRVEGTELVSTANGACWGIGTFETPSLGELRSRVASTRAATGRLSVSVVRADVRKLHGDPEYAGALFQVASQFNMLEMVHYDVTPEQGVTRYESDHTQGPACAIAAGAATLYRNYLVPVGDRIGQSRDLQLDGLAELGEALAQAFGRPVGELWTMRNGYAMCTASGLEAIGHHLSAVKASGRDALRARLRIGLHRDVEVTDAPGPVRPTVSQAFCSALPVGYSHVPAERWEPFARLVLEAAYEATLLAGLLCGTRPGRRIVALTRLGGGAFGNDGPWIDDGIVRALEPLADRDVDLRIVTLGEPSRVLRQLECTYPVSGRP